MDTIAPLKYRWLQQRVRGAGLLCCAVFEKSTVKRDVRGNMIWPDTVTSHSAMRGSDTIVLSALVQGQNIFNSPVWRIQQVDILHWIILEALV